MSTFQLRSHWSGDLSGSGLFTSSPLSDEFSAPQIYGGSGVGTNPEVLLLAASASCLLITLAAILKARRLNVTAIDLVSNADFTFDGRTLTLLSIDHIPTMQWSEEPDTVALQALVDVLKVVETGCMVSRALSVPTRINH